MALGTIDGVLPHPCTPPARRVVLVDGDAQGSALLARYLETRGWSVVLATDARRVVREWRAGVIAPLLVLRVAEDDPDAFELLAAHAARAISARIVVIGDLGEDARALGVERVLRENARYSDVAKELEELDGHAFVTKEAAS